MALLRFFVHFNKIYAYCSRVFRRPSVYALKLNNPQETV